MKTPRAPLGCSRLLALPAIFLAATFTPAQAVTIEILGTGTGALLGGDLTDPEDDGDPLAGATDPSWNWKSIDANSEPGFEGGEFAFNVFDNVLGGGNDKWCCDDATAEAPKNITVEFDQPIRLTHFTVSSANDVPGRDPTKWQIQGSNDGVNFLPIFIQDAPQALWTDRLQVILFTLDAPSLPYSFIRYEATETPEPLHQLGEIEYFGEVGSGADLDGDGMDDLWEELFGLDTSRDDSAEDPDGDGLTNLEEHEIRTNPTSADTDSDGLEDGVETATGIWNGVNDTGTNPSRPDTDGDGLLDGIENPDLPYTGAGQPGTSPLNADTDGDGASDGVEIAGGTDPTDPLSVATLHFGGGQWTTRFVHTAGTALNLDSLQSALDGEVELQLDVTVPTDYIHFHDNAPPPVYVALSTPYPGFDSFGDRDDFGIESTGEIYIKQSGQVTFACDSDDGFSFELDGVEIGMAGDRGRGATYMTVNVEAGVHQVRFRHWERAGGAGVTVAIARLPGAFTALTESNFELLRPFDICLIQTLDSDSDGMDDFKEQFYFGNLSRDGSGDFDEDGLADLAEIQLCADPTLKDSDGDGLEDGPEVATHNTDPTNADTDGDSLSDGDEINLYSTDPTNTDTDGDTYDDNVELALETDPVDANSKPDAIIAVANGGDWTAGSTWSDGLVPGPGKNYAAVGTVTPRIVTSGSNPNFAGDSLTLIGPGVELRLGHTGTATANLSLNGGNIAFAGSNVLGGQIALAGETMITVSANNAEVASRLAGSGVLHVVGGAAAARQGTVVLSGTGSTARSDIIVLGTELGVTTPGALPRGDVTLIGSRLLAATEINNPTSRLFIQGDTFTLSLQQNMTFADLVGLQADGTPIFSLVQLLSAGGDPPFILTADDLITGVGFSDDQVDGDGLLTITGGADDGDSDGDGLPDSWELLHFGNLNQGPGDDPDSDGLDNEGEFAANSDPNNPDTDGDTLTDGAEINIHGSDPTKIDTDNDGLTDAEEVALGTSPTRQDTDGDGLLDLVENNSGVFVSPEETGTDPTNPDTDGDGFADGMEVSSGTDPTDANSFPNADITRPGDAIVLVNGQNDDDPDAGPPPAAEGVEHAIDDVTQKYLNFLDLGSGFIVTPSLGSTVITGARFYPANDAIDRDPASYEIWGSTSGPNGDFTLIAAGDLDLPIDRNPGGQIAIDTSLFHQEVSFANNAAYTSYRVIFPTLRNAAAQNSMQIAEVELLGRASEGGGGGPLPVISNVRHTGTSMDFTFTTEDGVSYAVQYSTNQEAWVIILDDIPGAGADIDFSDDDPARLSEDEGYYRVLRK